MFDYLQQFNSLPKDLKDKVSSDSAMSLLSEIESRYRVDLAMVVMKVMIKTLTLKELPLIFASEFGLAPEQADSLTAELKTKIFSPVADYVGISSELRVLDLYKDINLLIKEAGLLIPSEFLVERLQKILATYLRGVRSRIDTRASLAKEIALGGLNLSAIEVDRVLKVCDSHKYKYNGETESSIKPSAPASRLDKIISTADKAAGSILAPKLSGEYDLKRALASGETKSIIAPEPLLEITAGHQASAESKIDKKPALASTPKLEAKPAVKPEAKQEVKPELKPELKPEIKAAPEKLIVQKPEANNLIKKLFADKNSVTKGAIRIANISDDAQVITKPLAAAAPEMVSKKSPSVSGKSQPSFNTAAARLAATKEDAGARKQIHDVKPIPKIMGPLEELQFLDLMNFRRLGKNPEEMTAKVFNKIKLLEHDGYEKMIMGISAWRKSPVNRMYLKIVSDAVSSNLPLKEAITARESRHEEGLSLEEIEAIMSLNSKLVF
ncbi:MAG: hypothetical protein HY931_02595 [Candidatus Falkowbacteria bacterium]|nr:MAG: hypothetical protein HY931_02595 [Candidatus Falkowbacteria bacterium]